MQRGLIAFGCEVVMRPTLHQVVCQLALCEQGIGGDEFAFNLDGIEQGREHADFVGLFLLATARYGQRANFFWV